MYIVYGARVILNDKSITHVETDAYRKKNTGMPVVSE